MPRANDVVERLEGRGSTQIDQYKIDISYQMDQYKIAIM